MLVVEVEAIGHRVDLERDAMLASRREDFIEIEIVRITSAYLPSARMTQHVDHSRRERSHDSPGHRLARLIELRVHARDDAIEAGQQLEREIERAIGEDIDFDASQ